MLMTEEEAKTKWCPMARPAPRCLGSNCAMWQWEKENEVISKKTIDAFNYRAYSEDVAAGTFCKEKPPTGWEFVRFDNVSCAHWIEPYDEAQKRRKGYCGLAGRPGVAA